MWLPISRYDDIKGDWNGFASLNHGNYACMCVCFIFSIGVESYIYIYIYIYIHIYFRTIMQYIIYRILHKCLSQFSCNKIFHISQTYIIYFWRRDNFFDRNMYYKYYSKDIYTHQGQVSCSLTNPISVIYAWKKYMYIYIYTIYIIHGSDKRTFFG